MVLDPSLCVLMIHRTAIPMGYRVVLALVARGPMADDGGPWLMSSGERRWMRVGVRDGWKMEDDNRGRTGHPAEFSTPKSDKIEIFLDVRRN